MRTVVNSPFDRNPIYTKIYIMKRSNLLNILKENLNKLWSFLDCAFLHWFGSYKQPKTVLQVPCYKNRLPLFLHTTLVELNNNSYNLLKEDW